MSSRDRDACPQVEPEQIARTDRLAGSSVPEKGERPSIRDLTLMVVTSSIRDRLPVRAHAPAIDGALTLVRRSGGSPAPHR
jgi:hypothetical protein